MWLACRLHSMLHEFPLNIDYVRAYLCPCCSWVQTTQRNMTKNVHTGIIYKRRNVCSEISVDARCMRYVCVLVCVFRDH